MPARPAAWLAAMLTVLAAYGCAAPLKTEPQLRDAQITVQALLNDSPIALGGEFDHLRDIDVLEITGDMRTFIEDHLRGQDDQRSRLQALIYAVILEGTFHLVYDDTTRTAAETFRERRGNCLSFTNMFIAMARYLGIEAHYQEVDVPPDWSLTGESYLLSKHVNVLMGTGSGERVVDFNVYDFKITFERNVVSDRRGRAHYFNNIGVERMLAGENASAHAYFRQSLAEDESFEPAWVNLGILHRREGFPAYAEAAYLQALRIDGADLVAMSNLANLYAAEGYPEMAAVYQARVQKHRMENPYYRYMLANEAFANGDYRTAIEHLRFAIDKREGEDRFLSLMSLCYLMSGDRHAAQVWMKKAEAAAREAEGKQKYNRKLRLLMELDEQG